LLVESAFGKRTRESHRWSRRPVAGRRAPRSAPQGPPRFM